MIDILVPSYKRPDRLKMMVDSAFTTAQNPDRVFIHVYLNHNDPTIDKVNLDYDNINIIVGGEAILSELWNILFWNSKSPIVMHGADDIFFDSTKWDAIVEEHFKANEIGLIYGFDGHQNENCPTHSFTTRLAAQKIGYFLPPYFEADFNDIWLGEVYRKLGKIKYEPRIRTLHLHRNVDMSYDDETYQIAEERRKRAAIVWEEKKHLIERDIEKLR